MHIYLFYYKRPNFNSIFFRDFTFYNLHFICEPSEIELLVKIIADMRVTPDKNVNNFDVTTISIYIIMQIGPNVVLQYLVQVIHRNDLLHFLFYWVNIYVSFQI